MTTIAYRDGVMVSDSCLSQGKGEENTLYVGSVDKLYRLNDGSLVGLSGDAEGSAIVAILNELHDRSASEIVDALQERVCAECSGLLVRPDGRMFWIATNGAGEEDDGGPYTEFQEFRDKFAAVGTGAWIAYGAMEANATARQAIEAACRRHAYTREPIQEMRLGK